MEKESCQKFFMENEEFAEILEILFQNTLYVQRTQILDNLRDNINKWKSEREDLPLYVSLQPGKIGSEYYFYFVFKDMLPPHKVLSKILPEDLDNIDGRVEILYLDDWSLTGTHMKDAYDIVYYKCINVRTEDEDIVKRYEGIKFHYTVIVSITSQKSLETFDKYDGIEEEDDLTQMYYNDVTFKTYYTTLVKPFREILTDLGYDFDSYNSPANRFFSRFCDRKNINGDDELISTSNPQYEFLMMVASPTFSPYPVHLDYKIANVVGSFPRIYKHCRYLAPNKSFMEDTIQFF